MTSTVTELNPYAPLSVVESEGHEDLPVDPELRGPRLVIASTIGIVGFTIGLVPSVYVLFTCLAFLLPHWGLNVSGGFWAPGIALACAWMIPVASIMAMLFAGVSRVIGNAQTSAPAVRGALLSPLAFVCLIACMGLAGLMGFHGY